MTIVLIDGQGGGLGKALAEQIRSQLPQAELIAVGTNSAATAAMLKGGALVGATGENAAVYNCARADVIIGALGIGFANSMHGEISPRMARAVGESPALKILLPVSKCAVKIAGAADKPMAGYIADALELLRAAMG